MSKVLLVGWDSADWRLIHPLLDAGAMPHLSALIENGVIADLGTLSPPVPSLLWASLITGQRANRHGILDRGEPKTPCRVPSVWHRLASGGVRSIAVGWSAAHATEMPGVFVSESYPRPTAAPGDPWPLLPGTIIPGDLEDPLAAFRVSPLEMDESILRAFVPRAGEVDQERDDSLAAIAILAAESFSIHAAASWILENSPWDFAAVRYPALGGFMARFLSAHRDPESLYGEVIPGALRLHDLFLGTLRQLAGKDATILLCSQCGISQTNQTPITSGLAYLQGYPGIFCAAGPGIRRDERVDGAGLLDVTPTILQLFAQPIDGDLEGRVLSEAFRTAPEIQRNPITAIADVPAETLTVREKWNLIHVYLETNRAKEAITLLEELYATLPEDKDVAMLFALALIRLGKPDRATRLLDRLDRPDLLPVRFLRSRIDFLKRRYPEAVETLQQIARDEPANVSAMIQTGQVYLAQNMHREAGDAFRRALDLRDDLPAAHVGMAQIHLRERRFPDAADSALRALQHQYHLPQAHYFLGVALYGLEMPDRAALAFETSLCFPAHSWRAHGWLARIYRRQGDASRAEHHRELWKTALARQRRVDIDVEEVKACMTRNDISDEAPVVADPHPLLVLTGLPYSGIHKIAALLKAGGLRIVLEENRLTRGHFATDERTVLLIPYRLLPQLPKARLIRVVVSDRCVEEMLAARRREQAARQIRPPGNTAMERELLQRERDTSLKALRDVPNLQALVVDIDAHEIAIWMERLQEFLAPLSLDTRAMREAILPLE